ncbi:ATP-dependent Clp protease ATP-binding subunit [Staphylococcus cohnii]|nr:ATP-dependent Clp protease ATP-binding subunit [Staphylococcus cohnii]
MREFPLIERFAKEMLKNYKYDALGREDKITEINAILNQPRMNSLIIRGLAGTGKTQVVETIAKRFRGELKIFEIDLDVMGNKGNNVFADNITSLVKEIIEYDKQSKEKIVIFIDEFHKIGKEGYEAGLEAFKPPLARGDVRLIGATTDEEYTEFIEKDEAFKERMEIVNMPELPREIVKKALIDMWQKTLGDREPVNEYLIDKIIDYGKYVPAEAEPRKSIRTLNRMIGYYNTTSVMMNEVLLDEIIFKKTGINTKFKPDIDNAEKFLSNRVKGQDYAIKVLYDSLHVAMAGLNPPDAPMGSFMFLGPTGVGKTELAKALAELLFGSEGEMIRFDMSEFKGQGSNEKFSIKAADKINRKPYSVVLCDEAEKASKDVLDLLLQITSDGRLENRYGRQVTFKNAYIILTTNVGHKSFEEARKHGEDLTTKPQRVNEILQREGEGFRPELINRMNALVPFNPLQPENRNEIVRKRLQEFKAYLAKDGIEFTNTKRVRSFLYKEGISDSTSAGGGRDINRRVSKHLYVCVAKLLNKYMYDEHRHILRIKVDVFGELVEEAMKRKSTAQLGIIAYDVVNDNGTVEMYRGYNDKNIDKTYDAQSIDADISYRPLSKEDNFTENTDKSPIKM